MTLLARYSGLELPIFESGTAVAWTQDEIVTAATNEAFTDFVRRTALIEIGDDGHRLEDKSLKDILSLTDRALDHMCEYVGNGASPVKHEWALYKGAPPHALPDYHRSDAHPSIPKGYSLVARVERVASATAIAHKAPLGIALHDSLHEYQTQLMTPPATRKFMFPQFVCFDTGLCQFVVNPQGTPILVDIEPRIGNMDSLWRLLPEYIERD